MLFDYAGSSSPAATVQSLLTASSHGELWDVGKSMDLTTATSGLTLGWSDNGSSAVTVMATYPGDFNLDGVVNAADLNIWFTVGFTGSTSPAANKARRQPLKAFLAAIMPATAGHVFHGGPNIWTRPRRL
jgi:hypothetical protein